MLDPDELRAAADSLRRLLAAADAGEVAADAGQRAHLQGAAEALERLRRLVKEALRMRPMGYR